MVIFGFICQNDGHYLDSRLPHERFWRTGTWYNRIYSQIHQRNVWRKLWNIWQGKLSRSMVILAKFRMKQYRDADHQEDATHFNLIFLDNNGTSSIPIFGSTDKTWTRLEFLEIHCPTIWNSQNCISTFCQTNRIFTNVGTLSQRIQSSCWIITLCMK